MQGFIFVYVFGRVVFFDKVVFNSVFGCLFDLCVYVQVFLFLEGELVGVILGFVGYQMQEADVFLIGVDISIFGC